MFSCFSANVSSSGSSGLVWGNLVAGCGYVPCCDPVTSLSTGPEEKWDLLHQAEYQGSSQKGTMINIDNRPDHTTPHQTRPDQTRPDQTRPDHNSLSFFDVYAVPSFGWRLKQQKLSGSSWAASSSAGSPSLQSTLPGITATLNNTELFINIFGRLFGRYC